MRAKQVISISLSSIIAIFIGIYIYSLIKPTMLPTEESIAGEMRSNYKKNTLVKIKDKVVNKGKFKFSIESFFDMYEDGAKQQATTLQVHFIELNEKFFPFQDYPELEKFRNKFYLAFTYANNGKPINDMYFILDGDSQKIDVSKIIKDLKNSYMNNIRSLTYKDENNTEYVSADMEEFRKYTDTIKEFSFLYGAIIPKKIEFELTEELKNGTNNINGNLTFFNNVRNNIFDTKFSGLSSYNANSLCPPCKK